MTSVRADQDCVHVEVQTSADLATTFRTFTERTDSWWTRGPRFRVAGSAAGTLHLEPFVKGRLFEAFEHDGVMRVVRVGRVRIWEPPSRLVLEWRAAPCAPDELSLVDVRFDAIPSGTRMVLEHRGWGVLAADHPARRALGPMDAFWSQLLAACAELATLGSP